MGKNSVFQKEFYNELINKYGFYIEEIGSEEDSIWIAIKTVDNGGLYTVIISKLEEEEKNYSRAKEYLDNKGIPYSLHNLILCKNNSISTNEEEFRLGTNYHRVFIDVTTKGIASYDKNSEPLVKILVGLFSREKEPKKPWYKNLKVGKTTAILIAINIIVFIGSVVVAGVLTGRFGDNVLSVDGRVLNLLGAKNSIAILQYGEFYRVITSMFLHAGIVHLAFNMYALYALGDTIERIYGRAKYLLIYFLSGIIACIASVIFSPSMGVGASGAIFGLLGAVLIFAYYEKHRIGKQFLINIVVVIVANILIGLGTPNIDNFAHIGGLAGGVLIGFFFYRYKIVKRIA